MERIQQLPKALDIKEASRYLGVTHMTVRKAVKIGKLPVLDQSISRSMRFRLEDLDALFVTNKRPEQTKEYGGE